MADKREIQFNLRMPVVAAGTGQIVRRKFLRKGTWLIKSCHLMPDDSVTQHASNVTEITLDNVTQSVELHSHDTTTGQEGTLTAGTIVAVTVPAAGRYIEEGDILAMEKADGGSGAAFEGSYELLLEEVA